MEALDYMEVVEKMETGIQKGDLQFDMFEGSTILAVLFDLPKEETLGNLVGVRKRRIEGE